MRLSRKMKLTVVGLFLISVLVAFFSSHYIQLSLMEHVTLKTSIVRMIAASQSLNTSNPMYGSFLNSSWHTMEAVDALKVLGGLGSVDTEAILHFLIGPDQEGPVDYPMHYRPIDNIDQAFVITHTAAAIGKLHDLPSRTVDKIRETIIGNQNSTSKGDYGIYWASGRTLLFETARLMNETSYVNVSFQKQEVLNDILLEIGQNDFEDFEVINLHWTLRAFQELHLIESGYPYVGHLIPETTKNMLKLYILSLWDESSYGFHESILDSLFPKDYESSIAATYYAVSSYIILLGIWEPYENDLKYEIGWDFENVLIFLSKCQNRYGIFFDRPSEVSDKVNSLQIPPFASPFTVFDAIMLLNNVGHLEILNQTVRWPPNPTLVEGIKDRFSK